MPQDLRLASGGGMLAPMAALVFRRQEELRTGKAVAPEQRRYN